MYPDNMPHYGPMYEQVMSLSRYQLDMATGRIKKAAMDSMEGYPEMLRNGIPDRGSASVVHRSERRAILREGTYSPQEAGPRTVQH